MAGGRWVGAAAVVIHPPIAVVAAVVLNDQARLRVVKVRSADEPHVPFVEIRLHPWMGQTCVDQEPAKPGFHRRFSWSGQERKGPQPRGASAAVRAICIFT